MTKVQRLTAKEFEEQKYKLRRLAASTIELARLILVEQVPNAEAAKRVNVSRQNVQKAMARVIALLSDLPPDYIWFEGFMSRERAKRLKEEIQEDLEAYARDESEKK